MPGCGDYSSDWPESPAQSVLFAGEIAAVRAVLGAGLPEADIVAVLSRCGGNTERAINALLDDAAAADDPKKGCGGGAAPTPAPPVKAEHDIGGAAPTPPPVKVKVKVKVEAPDEVVGSQDSDGSSARAVKVKRERIDCDLPVKEPSLMAHRVKEEKCGADASKKGAAPMQDTGISIVPRSKKRPREDEVETIDLTTTHPVPYLNPRPIRAVPPAEAMEMYGPRPARTIAPAPPSDWRMVAAPPEAEFGEFPVERDWYLVSRSYVTGLSTNRGRRMMDAGEIVHFAFPSYERIYGGIKVSTKKALALAEIVRFSTKRAGEVVTYSCHACHLNVVGDEGYLCAKLS